MMSLKRILVPVDFSDPSRKAVAYGAAIAERAGAKLYLAHIMQRVSGFAYVFPDAPSDWEQQRIASTRQALEDLLPPGREKLHVEVVAKIGAVEDELLGLVHDENIDLVIMGSRGRTRLRRVFLGSVTEHMLRKVPVPVLTISHIPPEREVIEEKVPSMERILFATDLGRSAENGIHASVQLAAHFGAALTVAHVVPLSTFGDSQSYVPSDVLFSEDARALAARLYDLTRPHLDTAKTIRTVLLQGEPYKVILRFADENKIDLIVLNLERKSVLERVLLGTTAEFIVRLAHVPVLSIPVEVPVEASGVSAA